jgi:hypothetical protein
MVHKADLRTTKTGEFLGDQYAASLQDDLNIECFEESWLLRFSDAESCIRFPSSRNPWQELEARTAPVAIFRSD